MLYGLQPVYAKHSRVMILGSMPSALSLQKGQYYGNPRNAMWTILCSLLEEPLEEDYQRRLQMVLRHGLAFWDMAYSCKRETSADSKIREVTPNDLGWILRECPKLEAFAFNGKKAYEMFCKFYDCKGKILLERDIDLLVMPSTSPAHAALRLEQKQEQWAKILPYLTKNE
ncbi:MAG TPA: DNA-deoxyinosine glycosylase [Firmicutes bacterium]|nr:DNA-deoxyinosine glycosylase [Bacillota bacterium]